MGPSASSDASWLCIWTTRGTELAPGEQKSAQGLVQQLPAPVAGGLEPWEECEQLGARSRRSRLEGLSRLQATGPCLRNSPRQPGCLFLASAAHFKKSPYIPPELFLKHQLHARH